MFSWGIIRVYKAYLKGIGGEMVKLKSLLLLSVLFIVLPARSCDLWRETKKFVIQNSGPIGAAALIAGAVYYYLQTEPDDLPEVKLRFKSILPKIQREYHAKNGKSYKKVTQMPVVYEGDADYEDLD